MLINFNIKILEIKIKKEHNLKSSIFFFLSFVSNKKQSFLLQKKTSLNFKTCERQCLKQKRKVNLSFVDQDIGKYYFFFCSKYLLLS
jgi:hypothetical protein